MKPLELAALILTLVLTAVLIRPGEASPPHAFPYSPGAPLPEGGAGGGPTLPAPVEPCGNRGVEWVDPHVVQAGGTICAGGFDISIGFNPASVSVDVHFEGCPSFIETLPGHYASVSKAGYDLVLPAQVWKGKTASYKCLDAPGWGTGDICIPDPDQAATPSDKTVLSYSEIVCKSVITTSR